MTGNSILTHFYELTSVCLACVWYAVQGVKVERSKRVVQEWHKRKQSELTERQKQVKEQAREKEEAEKEKERKKEASTVAHKEWDKQKSQHLVAQQRRHKREQERLKQDKEAESKERVGDAFDTWYVQS